MNNFLTQYKTNKEKRNIVNKVVDKKVVNKKIIDKKLFNLVKVLKGKTNTLYIKL